MAEKYGEQISGDMTKIQQLNYKTSAGSDVPCTWDIGSGSMGPGGIDGAYIRQCRKYAIINGDVPLCPIHAKKYYIDDARKQAAASSITSGKKLRLTAMKRGVFKPTDALVTAGYFKQYKSTKASGCAIDGDNRNTARSGVYDLDQAMCLMTKQKSASAEEDPSVPQQ